MKISESFIKDIIESEFPDNYQLVYDNSNLIQYLDKKMGAVHGVGKISLLIAKILKAECNFENFYKYLYQYFC